MQQIGEKLVLYKVRDSPRGGLITQGACKTIFVGGRLTGAQHIAKADERSQWDSVRVMRACQKDAKSTSPVVVLEVG